MSALPHADQTARPNYWRRVFLEPVLDQLKQGITPNRIAFTIALGLALSIFPILGATTILCLIAGATLRLNQPVLQVVNHACYPLQLGLLIPFYRAGETLFHQPHIPLSIPLFFQRIHANFFRFLRDFGRVALEGVAVWCLLAPFLICGAYFLLRPALQATARRFPGHGHA